MKLKLKKFLLTLMAAAITLLSVTACSSDAKPDSSAKKADLSKFKIGEITSLVVNDGGWCQATHQSLLRSMKSLGIPEKNLVVLENVSEDQVSVENAYNALVSQDVNLIIGASSGYAPFLSDLADQNPDIVVAQQGNRTNNLVGYQIRNYEGMFLAGYACALMSPTKTLGYAASMSEASVRSAINGFALGAKYADPAEKVQVVWANSWYDVDIETQNAQTLINRGIKYMGMEASSPAIPQTCQSKGAFCIGYNVDMKNLAPKAVLFSYMWNFTPIFTNIIQKTVNGKENADDYYFEGGESAAISDFNNEIVPKDVQKKVLQVKSDIASGKVKVYAGELKDNKGNILVPRGKVLSDDKIISQEFLVDNVIGDWK